MNNIILLLDTNALIALGVAILSGGLLIGITAFRKAKPEMAKITVEVAGQAVIVQKGVIDSLQNELLRQGAELKEIEKENANCQKENRELRGKLEDLQFELQRYNSRIDRIEEKQK